MLAHCQVFLLHVSALWLQHEAGYLEVAEARLLNLQQQLVGQLFQPVVFLQLMLQVDDVLQSLQEPHVDLRQLFYALHAVALLQCLRYGEDAQVGGVLQLVVNVLEACVVVAHESVHALAYHAQPLLYHLLKRASYRHYLAHRLHARANESAYACELRQVPAWYLADHVVEARSDVCRRCGAHLANLVEGVAQGYLCCHECQRIACCF